MLYQNICKQLRSLIGNNDSNKLYHNNLLSENTMNTESDTRRFDDILMQ